MTKTRNERNVKVSELPQWRSNGSERFWLTRKYGHESEDSSGLCALLLGVSQPLRDASRASAYTTAAWTLPAPAMSVPSYTCQCVSVKKQGRFCPCQLPSNVTRGNKAHLHLPFCPPSWTGKIIEKRDNKKPTNSLSTCQSPMGNSCLRVCISWKPASRSHPTNLGPGEGS